MDNRIKKKIGYRLSDALRKKDIQQKELAKAVGVPDNTVSYWCSGTRTPNTAQIIKIAEYLGVSADYLLGLTDASTNDRDLRFVCDYTGLSEEAVNLLVDAHRKTFLSGGYNSDDQLKVAENLENAPQIISQILSNEHLYSLIAKRLIVQANGVRLCEILSEFDKAYEAVFSKEGITPTEKDKAYVFNAYYEVLRLYNEAKAYAYDMQEEVKDIFPLHHDLPSIDKADKMKGLIHKWTYVRTLEEATHTNTGGAEHGEEEGER